MPNFKSFTEHFNIYVKTKGGEGVFALLVFDDIEDWGLNGNSCQQYYFQFFCLPSLEDM